MLLYWIYIHNGLDHQPTHTLLGWLHWAGLGWAGLGWAGLGWAGLGWAGLGWAGLGYGVSEGKECI